MSNDPKKDVDENAKTPYEEGVAAFESLSRLVWEGEGLHALFDSLEEEIERELKVSRDTESD